MRHLIAIAVLAASLAAADAARASCAPLYTDEKLPTADGAFVGTVEAVRTEQEGRQTYFTFRVERVFKGELGDRVEVRDEYGLSSISLRAEVGERLALMATRSDTGEWVSNDCRRTSEEALIDATRPPCRSSGRPARPYRRKPPESGLRYATRPRVVGCGRTGGRHFQLIAARMKPDRGRSFVCLDVLLPRERTSFGCGRPRVRGGENVEVRGQAGSEGGRRLLTGATHGFTDAVRVEYQVGDTRLRRAAAQVHVDDARVLRRLRLRRPFGFYVAAVPPGAGGTRVTALAWHGGALGSADSPFD